MLNLKKFQPRKYQESIFQTAKDNNTLAVLPTGVGKTGIALLLILDRLNKFPSKIIFCSPTKPLCSQHVETLKEHTDIPEVHLYTGTTPAKKRKEIFDSADVIVATPQTIQSDLKNKRISLQNVSLLIIDEAHRTVKNYSYNIISTIYLEQSEFPRILALTASPGGDKKKIDEIRDNLAIESVEIRTEDDEEVSPYLQKRNISWIKVQLPKELINIQKCLQKVQKERLFELKKYHITKPLHLVNRRDLIDYLAHFRGLINQKNPMGFQGISLVSQLLKLSHALESLETQTLSSLKTFLNKIQIEKTKAAIVLKNHPEIKKSLVLIEKIEDTVEHPKLERLKSIVESQLDENPESKIIIFANFRNTASVITKVLKKIKNAKVTKLIGQKDGLSQKQQIKLIEDFEDNIYNIIVSTSIGEEGLSINSLDLAIFYESVSSSIRRIQRSGRVGRVKPGKIIFLITENTRDEAFYWKSLKEEQKMKNILKNMQKKEEQKTLI
jgi:ERCC4-related helicase